jgi:hypothetical protein
MEVTCLVRHRSPGTLCLLAALGVSLGQTASAAPPLTTIKDTLYKADGSLFDGILIINWRSFEGPDTSNIPTNSLSVQVSRGNLLVRLVPTTTSPRPAYYSVRYVTEGSVQFSEIWSVPPSAQPLRVRQVRIEWPPSSSPSQPPPTQPPPVLEDIRIDDVEGLRQELEVRPRKGLGYLPSRAAVIGPTGELEAAAGDLDECVRVDGSTGPCGSSSAMAFIDGEEPQGAVDGSNRSFTLSGTPAPPASLLLYRNGVLQKQGEDYTLQGNVVNFALAATPQPGDVLVASYRVDGALAIALGMVDGETPSGVIDGVNRTFALAGTPRPARSLFVYRNGLLQKEGLDYTLNGNVITFEPASTPLPGDILTASYRMGGF